MQQPVVPPNKMLKPAVMAIVLITNALVWYYFVIQLLLSVVQAQNFQQAISFSIWALHFGGIGLSAIMGALIVRKSPIGLLFFWIFSGVILSISTIVIDLTVVPNILVLSLLLGVALGFGMPSCMSFFADSIPVEKRGSIGGIIFLLTGLIIVVLGMTAGEAMDLKAIILFGWRALGLIVFVIFLKYWSLKEELGKNKVLTNQPLIRKSFLLYLIPWLMFSLISNLTAPMQSNIIQSIQSSGINLSMELVTSLDTAVIAISAIISGFFIDHVGRKRMSIIGFALLGVGYSFLGILSSNPVSWYFFAITDGIVWGIFFVIFVVTVWADLSTSSAHEKYYAVGVLPFFISYFFRFTIGFDLSQMVPKEAIFSFVAFFLFLAVLPLVYAPETLPEKQIKDRELKNYIDKAQKVREKYS